MRRKIGLFLTILLMVFPGCGQVLDGPDMERSYTQITQEEAKQMMAQDDGHIILDVRRRDEYEQGHLPGAVLLPNEEIGSERPAELPDPDQIILIYCRSGNRSKQAAQKLFDLGYTNVYEFGGILTWDGEIEKGEADVTKQGIPAVISFSSFDGGGPEFTVEVEDAEMVSVVLQKDYGTNRDEVIDGAAFEEIITFTGQKAGETTATVQARSPIAGNFDTVYRVTVDKDGNVTLTQVGYYDLDAETETVPTLVLEANGVRFYADFEDNPSAEAFCDQLSENGVLTVELHDYGNFEKVGDLPFELVRSDTPITTRPGDIILYQGKQITVYYDENTWNFTKLARIEGKTREDLLGVFGDGDVSVSFWVEWSE